MSISRNKINKRIGYLLSYFHFFVGILATIPFYSKNLNILLFFVFYWFILVYSWYFFGNCFLTIIENRLMGYTNDNSFWFIEELKRKNKFIGNFIYFFIRFQPIFWIFFLLLKIKNLCKKNI